MRSYIAESQGQSFPGSYGSCLSWAIKRVKEESDCLVKIYTARAGESMATVIAEITDNNVRLIKNGRKASLKSFIGCR